MFAFPLQSPGAYRLSHRCTCSTIGTTRLNFRVRDGNGCGPRVISTGTLKRKKAVFPYEGNTVRRMRRTAFVGWVTLSIGRIGGEGSSLRPAILRRRGRKALLDTFRAISTARLKTLLPLHLLPIDQVVSLGPYHLSVGESHLGISFPLRCFQRLSIPNLATRRCRWSDNRYTRGSFNPVLSY
jgi:hypothetical protein